MHKIQSFFEKQALIYNEYWGDETAIYGSRGSNGVIIINTKRGKTGKPSISLDTYYGFQKIAFHFYQTHKPVEVRGRSLKRVKVYSLFG